MASPTYSNDGKVDLSSGFESLPQLLDPAGELVTIPMSEYISLKEDRDFLNRLQAAGVDNWEGYDMACEELDMD